MNDSNHYNILEVQTEADLRRFVEFPFRLYSDDAMWVPPMKNEEMGMLRPSDNPSFSFCDIHMWMVQDADGVCVGRIATIINRVWQQKTGLNYGRISRFDVIDSQEVANLLLSTAEDYLRGRGVEAVHGPLGFSNLDHQGILVEGFEWMPSIGSEYSKEYYHRLIENYGYTKEKDWIEFRLTFPKQLPEKSLRVAEAIESRYRLRCKSFESKAELQKAAPVIFDLFNDAFSSLFGTYRFDRSIMQFYIKKYMPVLVPRYVKVVEREDGSLAGFIIAMPSLSRAMQKAKGSLWPLGWWHVMKALKHPTEVDLLLTGVAPELQKMGVASLLMNALWKTAHEDGVEFVETTGMLEDNKVAIQMWKTFEYIQHKRKRCYIKHLTD